MEIHPPLTRSNVIRNFLPRHEQGGIFAADGYARSSGLPGVCIATSDIDMFYSRSVSHATRPDWTSFTSSICRRSSLPTPSPPFCAHPP
ncbi:hypothetical protein K1719_005996 [Acacia pycnantha]|nr:hypothetical protein K1719_005996 [Acacia pycnantha]